MVDVLRQARNRRYVEKHRQAINEYNKVYQLAHPEMMKQAKLKYYRVNRNRLIQENADYRKRRRERKQHLDLLKGPLLARLG